MTLLRLSATLRGWEYNDGWHNNGEVAMMPPFLVNGGSNPDPHWGIPEGAGEFPPLSPVPAHDPWEILAGAGSYCSPDASGFSTGLSSDDGIVVNLAASLKYEVKFVLVAGRPKINIKIYTEGQIACYISIGRIPAATSKGLHLSVWTKPGETPVDARQWLSPYAKMLHGRFPAKISSPEPMEVFIDIKNDYPKFHEALQNGDAYVMWSMNFYVYDKNPYGFDASVSIVSKKKNKIYVHPVGGFLKIPQLPKPDAGKPADAKDATGQPHDNENLNPAIEDKRKLAKKIK